MSMSVLACVCMHLVSAHVLADVSHAVHLYLHTRVRVRSRGIAAAMALGRERSWISEVRLLLLDLLGSQGEEGDTLCTCVCCARVCRTHLAGWGGHATVHLPILLSLSLCMRGLPEPTASLHSYFPVPVNY